MSDDPAEAPPAPPPEDGAPPAPPGGDVPKCEECKEKDAALFCKNCEAALCQECLAGSHASAVLKRHTQIPIADHLAATAGDYCSVVIVVLHARVFGVVSARLCAFILPFVAFCTRNFDVNLRLMYETHHKAHTPSHPHVLTRARTHSA